MANRLICHSRYEMKRGCFKFQSNIKLASELIVNKSLLKISKEYVACPTHEAS
jgi:hypothetical protein